MPYSVGSTTTKFSISVKKEKMSKDKTSQVSCHLKKEESKNNNSHSADPMDVYWEKLRMDCQFRSGQKPATD